MSGVVSAPADEDDFVWRALGFYAWNLLAAAPILEIPQTLNWKPPTKEEL